MEKNEDSDAIISYDITQITYDDFFENHLRANQPCIIRNVCQNWSCADNWIENDAPNFEYLSDTYGSLIAPVANCEEKYYNAQPKERMTLRAFLDYWKDFRESDYSPTKLHLYLKDWHLPMQYKCDKFYETPSLFKSDWLNEYADATEGVEDYKFVYMGPASSWTPLHVDIFTSYSWSVNICGQKKWYLLPPGEENKLEANPNNAPLDVSADLSRVKWYAVLQNAREAIFVPSGWYHQVHNMLKQRDEDKAICYFLIGDHTSNWMDSKDTISINHNWFNSCNIDKVWNYLKKNLSEVEKEISDVKNSMLEEEWMSHCQRLLKSCFGMDFNELSRILIFVAKRRKSILKTCSDNSVMKYAADDLRVANEMLREIRRVAK